TVVTTKRRTLRCPSIRDRKTREAMSCPLPGLLNVVVIRNADYAAEGATVCTSLEDALRACAHEERVCLIGGEQLFRLALPCTDEIIATEIHADIDGDTWFPALEAGEWEEIDRQPQPAENG